MRALLATAGLLVLAGAAAAAKPTAHTLRKSASGPIAAIAQDSGFAAWLTFASSRGCDAVHVLAPGQRDRSSPQPSSGSMTCHWNLADGHPQLAIAARLSMALWTLHESGPSPFDVVAAAPIGGPERRVAQLAHASDGTGDWLGGVAGSGKTLAYSWDDVEYVDKLACLSGGSCKEKIANGGIRLVTPSGSTALAEAQPALQLAAAGGRIAYVPATAVKAGRPTTTTSNTLQVVDAISGESVGQASVHGFPIAIALSPAVLAVLTTQGTAHDRISWFSAIGGTKLGSAVVSGLAAPQLAASDRVIIYRVGLFLHAIATKTGRIQKLVKTGQNYVGLSLSRGRLLWAENHNRTARLRALAVG